jgi:hypothetical protein
MLYSLGGAEDARQSVRFRAAQTTRGIRTARPDPSPPKEGGSDDKASVPAALRLYTLVFNVLPSN